jgi:hypothetical protein
MVPVLKAVKVVNTTIVDKLGCSFDEKYIRCQYCEVCIEYGHTWVVHKSALHGLCFVQKVSHRAVQEFNATDSILLVILAT